MKHSMMWLSLSAVLLTGCASQGVEMVDTRNDNGAAVAGLDYRDLEAAEAEALQSLLTSPVSVNPNGGRYIVMLSDVTNDTMQRFDTSILTQKIFEDLTNSGRFAPQMAIGTNGPQDRARAMLMNQGMTGGTGKQLDADVRVDLSLAGKIIQRNVPAGNKVQIEYYFNLNLMQISTGVALWTKQVRIIKRASGKTATW